MSKFKCDECGERCDDDDRSTVYPELCESCGDTRMEGEVDDYMDEVRMLVDDWYDTDRLANLDKLLAFAKQFPTPAKDVAQAQQSGQPKTP
jgi:hypothetical protein